MAFKDSFSTGRPYVQNSIFQLISFLLDADRRPSELGVEVGVRHKTVLHILHDILIYRKPATLWKTHEISDVQQWHRYAVAQALLHRYRKKGDDFIGRIFSMDKTWARSYEPNLKRQSNEWKLPG